MKGTMLQQELTEQEFYQFISKGISCEEILSELSKFVEMLQNAFDDSHSRCKDFLTRNGKIKKANRQFYPQMMRFLVHNYLEADGIKNQLVDENVMITNENEGRKGSKWQPSVLASNGIAGIILGYSYRVFKALKYKYSKGHLIEPKRLEDLLPPPGSSEPDSPKCKFYCQSHLKAYQQHLMLPEDYEKPALKPNIIFLWDVDKNGFIKLYLVIPKWGNGRQASVYGVSEIKHPAETIVSEKPTTIDHNIIEITASKIKEQNINDEIKDSLWA
jgi:hypothetical protein